VTDDAPFRGGLSP